MGSPMAAVPVKPILIGLALLVIVASVLAIALWQTGQAADGDDGTPDASMQNGTKKFGGRFRPNAPPPRDGQQFPVPRKDLYKNYDEKDEHLNELFDTDYDCRYSQSSRNCYCCGAFFHYTEQGKICTKFCLKWKGRGNRPRFCQKRLIQLPFNWGDDVPDKVTLDNRQRWSRETEVEMPYHKSTAPRGCPQDPYIVEGEDTSPMASGWKEKKKSKVPSSTSPTTIRASPPANAFPRVPPPNAFPRVPPPKATNPRNPKIDGTFESSMCTEGSQCVPVSQCPSFAEEKEAWSRLTRGSTKSVQALAALKAKICSRSPSKVCCGGSSGPRQISESEAEKRPASNNAYPRIPPKTEPPKAVSLCRSGVKCQPMTSCPSFQNERRRWKELPRGSVEYTSALNKLKALICNKESQMVCCTG